MPCLGGSAVYYICWVNFTSDAKDIKHLHKVDRRINSVWWITLQYLPKCCYVILWHGLDFRSIWLVLLLMICTPQGPNMNLTEKLFLTSVSLEPGYNTLIFHWCPTDYQRPSCSWDWSTIFFSVWLTAWEQGYIFSSISSDLWGWKYILYVNSWVGECFVCSCCGGDRNMCLEGSLIKTIKVFPFFSADLHKTSAASQ